MAGTLLDVAPYAVSPAVSGGALAIHQANEAVSRYWNVQLISQGLRRKELLKLCLKPRSTPMSVKHTPSYDETRLVSLRGILAGLFTGQRAGSSLLSANWTLRILRPATLLDALDQSDLLQVEHPWQVPILARWNRKKRPLVTVAHNIETYVVKGVGRAKREVEATRRREIEAVSLSDAVIAFTEDDRKGLLEMTGADAGRIHTISLGVDTDRVKPVSAEARARAKALLGLEGKRIALFIGALYEPNIQAVSALFEVASRLDRKDLLFVVVGRVGESFRSNDRVLVTGQVDDVLTYFAAADLAVNPMRTGGGMQVKLLEFLAAGLPTVTTPVGARGLAAGSGRDLVVAEVDQFPDAIAALLKDEALAQRLAEGGRRLVESHYSWDAIAKARVALYERLVAKTNESAGL